MPSFMVRSAEGEGEGGRPRGRLASPEVYWLLVQAAIAPLWPLLGRVPRAFWHLGAVCLEPFGEEPATEPLW